MKNVFISILILLCPILLAAQDDDAKRSYNKGLALYNLDNFTGAIPHLSEAVVYYWEFESAHHLLAICYNETNQFDKSITHYEEVIRINPHNKKAMYNLSKQYQKDQRFGDARAILEEALLVDANYQKAKSALVNLDKIESGNTQDEDIEYYKANSFYKQKKYNDAIKLLIPLNEQSPTPNTLYLEGLCQEKVGDLNEAVERFQSAVGLDPTYIDGHIGMGIIRFNQQEYEEATGHFANVLRLEKEPSEEFTYFLGNSYFRLANYEQAIGYLTEAVNIDPNSGRAHYTLYKLYEETEDDEKSTIHRIRAEELGYYGDYSNKALTKSKTVNQMKTSGEEITEEVIIKRRGVSVKGLERVPEEEIEEEEKKKPKETKAENTKDETPTTKSKKETREAKKLAKLEQKAWDKANKDLRKKQKKNPTYRD